MTDAIAARPPVRLAQAAAQLNLSTWTLRTWCREGRVRHHRLGHLIMLPAAEIERLLRESSIEPQRQS